MRIEDHFYCTRCKQYHASTSEIYREHKKYLVTVQISLNDNGSVTVKT